MVTQEGHAGAPLPTAPCLVGSQLGSSVSAYLSCNRDPHFRDERPEAQPVVIRTGLGRGCIRTRPFPAQFTPFFKHLQECFTFYLRSLPRRIWELVQACDKCGASQSDFLKGPQAYGRITGTDPSPQRWPREISMLKTNGPFSPRSISRLPTFGDLSLPGVAQGMMLPPGHMAGSVPTRPSRLSSQVSSSREPF